MFDKGEVVVICLALGFEIGYQFVPGEETHQVVPAMVFKSQLCRRSCKMASFSVGYLAA